MNNLVTATVRVENIKHFIGHLIWTKPLILGYSAQNYHRLIKVQEKHTGNKYYPIEVQAFIEYQGEEHEVQLPQACTVKNVPKNQCTPIDYNGTRWWKWTPPATQLAMF